MEGLEKAILDPTEPDDDDVRHNDSGDDDDDAPPPAADAGGAGMPNIPRPRMRRKGNTGVKGVLADYAEAQVRCVSFLHSDIT